MQIIPIQIIGTQRSGSNLLRTILNQSPEISAHHPPHILSVFYPILGQYGDLNDSGHFKKLIHDVCRLIETNPVAWHLKLDRDAIAQICSQRTVVEIFRVVYELMAKQDGARYWVCKSMANVNYFTDLEANGMKPYYIHLIRDGRDVAASFKKTIVGEKHIYHLAQVWKNNYLKAKRVEETVGHDRCLTVYYENLISHPHQVLEQLNAFLGSNIDESALDYFNSEESKATAAAGTMWQNLTKPILTSNSKKFLTAFSSQELEIFERVAGDALQACGYQRVSEVSQTPFSEAEIMEFNKQNEAWKAHAQQASELELDRQFRVKRNELLTELKAFSKD
ncbi:MAG: hypothetical protein RLZZ241_2149 [Bacteroidota bacterium]|jgi:hypothetical protein